MNLPSDVTDWCRSAFADCNASVTEKLTMSPNVQEEALDQSWVDVIGRHSSPRTLSSGWTVKIETHYLGGLRHYNGWEIADIGVLVYVRPAPGERRNKVALLQSKRLYPKSSPVRDETRSDYEVGMARLADPENDSLSIAQEAIFRFDESSRYGALKLESDQVKAIRDYMSSGGARVYYQLYNPWSVPFEQRIPLAGYAPPTGAPDLGTRIVPATVVHNLAVNGATPALTDLAALGSLPDYGWRLEDFISNEMLGCREGDLFESADEKIQRLFYRRSGPISAAIAVTIEAPNAMG